MRAQIPHPLPGTFACQLPCTKEIPGDYISGPAGELGSWFCLSSTNQFIWAKVGKGGGSKKDRTYVLLSDTVETVGPAALRGQPVDVIMMKDIPHVGI